MAGKKAGVMLTGGNIDTAVYREVLGLLGEIFRKGDQAEDYLDGPPSEPVFRRI